MTIPEFYLDEVDSTMHRARELTHLVGDDIFRVRANHQTEGRGRRGRRWLDVPGESLMMTIGVRRLGQYDPGDSNPGIIALRTGAALAEAVAEILTDGPFPEIKWPNDLLLDGRKLAGVLVEADPRWFFIGVGVNLYHRENAGAISRQWSGSTGDLVPVSLREFLSITDEKILLSSLDNAFFRYISGNGWRDAVNRRLAWRNRSVTVDGAGVEITGKVAGVGVDGALLLKGSRGLLPVYAGTVRLQDPR